ncbi:hypothetical protein [Natrinema halophilum]|uniref:Uncharacterized protein n=1 Tax=Natrinema halophilum TaxID=1699371 RepID=A0A7D5KLX2_9EURY|nr:hypothetical protein [Natrinema halophilum]QLG50318.1 hypothetical protein HYG82_16450 [Natrinema halophilum]
MAERCPEWLSERLRADGDGPLALDIRLEADVDDRHIPNGIDDDDCDELPDDHDATKGTLATDPTALEDGQTAPVGQFEIISAPGRDEGCVSFDIDGAGLLTGEMGFQGRMGRVYLGVEAGIEESDTEQNAATLHEHLQRLLERPNDAVVLPAHEPCSPETPVYAALAAVSERATDLGRGRAGFVGKSVSLVSDHAPSFERLTRSNVGQESVPADELVVPELCPRNGVAG